MSIQSMPANPAIPGSNPPLAAHNVAPLTPRAVSTIGQASQTDQSQISKADEAPGTGGQNVDAKELASAIDKVQDVTKTLANELKFSIDEDSGQTVVKIVDTATDEVIRQIPSKEMLAIAKALDQIQGLLIKQKA